MRAVSVAMNNDSSTLTVILKVQPAVIHLLLSAVRPCAVGRVGHRLLAHFVIHVLRLIQLRFLLNVRSTDNPEVSTFLVEKLWALSKAITFAIKFGFASCILLIYLNIGAERISPTRAERTSAMFFFCLPTSIRTSS